MRNTDVEPSNAELETRNSKLAGVRLTLVYLYGDLMSLYGDRGNVLAVQRRCAWRGIDVEVRHVGLGGRLDAAQTDLLFFGGGQDREQETVSRDLAAGNGDAIREAVDAGAALLAVCGGYQLLGRFFRTADGVEIPGTGLFDAATIAGATRLVGNVVAEAWVDGARRTLVGFENHSGRTYLEGKPPPQPFAGLGADSFGGLRAGSLPERGVSPSPTWGTVPLAWVVVGKGNNGEDGHEGARRGGAIGTYLHGPILPKNPWLADWLILTALRRRLGPEVALDPLDDSVESAASSVVERRFRKKGNVRASIR